MTIIGISKEFKSETCEVLKNIKGFNYFCATNDDDIKKNVFEEFDFNFFPSAFDIEISLEVDGVESFQTYGATDGDFVYNYNGWSQKGIEK